MSHEKAPDLLRIFRIATAGFLKVKFIKNSRSIWPAAYISYWVSLHGNQLTAYTDETEAAVRHQYTIDRDTTVTVEEIQYYGTRSNIICKVSQRGKAHFYFSCEDPGLCENWMIVIIERSRGFFDHQIENFELKNDVMDDELDVQSETRSTFTISPTLEGFLSRHTPSSVFSKWAMSWVELKDDTMRCWHSDDKSARDRTQCSEFLNIDAFSRVGVIDGGRDGHCSFFVAAKQDDETFVSWRFCCTDGVLAAEWVRGIQDSIRRCQYRHSAAVSEEERLFPMDKKTTRSSIRSAADAGDLLVEQSPPLEDRNDMAATKDFSDPSRCPVLYERDNTLMGGIMQLLRGSEKNKDHIRQFYLQKFCHPVVHGFVVENEHAAGVEDVICVSVFENQRFLPINGFSALNLVIGLDPAKLSDMDGCKFPDRYLRLATPPDGYEWVPDSSFKVDFTHAETGQGGWTYASSFPRYSVHKKQRRSLTDINHYKAKTRRRRWVRRARKISNESYC